MKIKQITFLSIFFVAFSCYEKKVEEEANKSLEIKFDSMFTKTNSDSTEINKEDNEEILTYIEDNQTDPFKVEESMSGIGVVLINNENENSMYRLNVYDEKNKQILKIELNDSQVVTTYLGKKTTQYGEKNEPICPRYFSPSTDYFGLIFDCIDSTKEFYKVMLDRKNNTIGYIKKEENAFRFETYEDFVNGYIRSLGFDINRLTNPVRKEPNDKSDILDDPIIKKYNFWNMSISNTEMKGDWLKVKLDKEKFGWVRWRKGKKFQIKMYFTC